MTARRYSEQGNKGGGREGGNGKRVRWVEMGRIGMDSGDLGAGGRKKMKNGTGMASFDQPGKEKDRNKKCFSIAEASKRGGATGGEGSVPRGGGGIDQRRESSPANEEGKSHDPKPTRRPSAPRTKRERIAVGAALNAVDHRRGQSASVDALRKKEERTRKFEGGESASERGKSGRSERSERMPKERKKKDGETKVETNASCLRALMSSVARRARWAGRPGATKARYDNAVCHRRQNGSRKKRKREAPQKRGEEDVGEWMLHVLPAVSRPPCPIPMLRYGASPWCPILMPHRHTPRPTTPHAPQHPMSVPHVRVPRPRPMLPAVPWIPFLSAIATSFCTAKRA